MEPEATMTNLLAGDIGGTKTVLAVFASEIGPHQPQEERSFPSGRYTSLEAIVQKYLDQVHLTVGRACFGVAGPILAGSSKITNLPWIIQEAALKNAFDFTKVTLVNDLEAVAWAIPILERADISTLCAGSPLDGGTIAVIAPGTGLGEAFLTWEEGRYHAHATEGGHATFAPTDDLQLGLLKYMHDTLGYPHVSVERVCSGGLGIPNMYTYLKELGVADEPAWLAEQLINASDPTPVIVEAAQNPGRPCELAAATLRLFVSILGAEAGNLALKVLATGGIYLGGGIPPRIVAFLQEPIFLEALCSKGRFRPLLTDIPVHVILNPQVALMGAAARGLARG
jgi:glucokinase